MTIHQLKVIIETVRGGTISYAAKKLNLSQPNASNNIKSVENELGFPIFIREGSGIRLTDSGRIFLEHAEKIISESEEIQQMKENSSRFRLRLGVMNYSPAIDAYLKLCTYAQGFSKVELSYITTSPNDGVKLLHDHQMDMAAVIYMNEYIPAVERMCRENHLEIIPITKVSYNVNIRKGHPLDQRKNFLKDIKDIELLKDYPYVDYSRLSTVVGPMNGESTESIPFKYRILVDERDARCRLLSMTDAFSVGCQLSGNVRERYGLVCYPIANDAAVFSCIIRNGEKNYPEIQTYLKLLSEEVKDLNKKSINT